MEYIDKSALVAEIENLLKPVRQRLERDKDDPWDSDIAIYKFSDKLIKNIDTLEVKEVKEEPVSEDLEEASVEWFNSVKYKSDLSGTPISAFKAGAEWQKKQMVNDAMDIEYDNLVAYDIIYKICQVLGEGGKGKMIIVKQEEE